MSPMPCVATTAAEHNALYAALLARDARFDGRLFVGVTSTGIYCRPVCRVRAPAQRHCRFFAHAAGAAAAGFRPCLRCRPELAPGLALVDSSPALADHAARLFDLAAAEGRDLYIAEVAQRLGVTERHLRRIFQRAYGVAPLAYFTTRRLLQAKHWLTDTALPVAAVAQASGFTSVRRFNAVFAQCCGFSPTALRQRQRGTANDHLTVLKLAYRPPYDVHGMLRFFALRALPGVEEVDIEALEIRRSLCLQRDGRSAAGWVAMRYVPERAQVHLRCAESLLPLLGSVAQRVRQTLDLDAEPALIDAAQAALPVPPRAGLRVAGSLCGFEAAVRIILGQQVALAAARTLTGRLVQAFGTPLATPYAGIDRLFPTAQALAAAPAAAIGSLGVVRQRVAALQALAAAVADGRLSLHRTAPLAATLAALRGLPGIGEWTVQLIAMRALAWPDAFAASDVGVMKALGTRNVRDIEAQSVAWKPWRAYAVMRLWQTLDKA